MAFESYRLVQEDYQGDPWRIVVCCLMLNRTRGEIVKPVAKTFFEKRTSVLMMKSSDHTSQQGQSRELSNTSFNYSIDPTGFLR